MAVAGYMTEADAESIWGIADFDTTRFGKINVRIAKMINFLVGEDAATDITDTRVLPVLEQVSEEIFIELKIAAQGGDAVDPWDFIQANISRIDWKYYDGYLLRKVKKLLGYEKMEMSTRRLPDTTDTSRPLG